VLGLGNMENYRKREEKKLSIIQGALGKPSSIKREAVCRGIPEKKQKGRKTGERRKKVESATDKKLGPWVGKSYKPHGLLAEGSSIGGKK